MTAAEFTYDLDGGIAGLHADVESCRVDLDWTATGGKEDGGSLNLPDRVDPGIVPPSVFVWMHERDVTYTTRQASIARTVCAAAGVAGPPKAAGLVSYSDADRTTSIRIDPTR